MKRISETTFPGKFVISGSRRYIAVPVAVADRMGFRDGELLDVTVKWPKTEEYDPEDMLAPAPDKPGKKPKDEE